MSSHAASNFVLNCIVCPLILSTSLIHPDLPPAAAFSTISRRNHGQTPPQLRGLLHENLALVCRAACAPRLTASHPSCVRFSKRYTDKPSMGVPQRATDCDRPHTHSPTPPAHPFGFVRRLCQPYFIRIPFPLSALPLTREKKRSFVWPPRAANFN